MTLYLETSKLLNPRNLPYAAQVQGWSVSYHKTENAAQRAVSRAENDCRRNTGCNIRGIVARVISETEYKKLKS